jgi:MFS family permease
VRQSREGGAPGLGLATARRAVSLCFFLNGVVIASWVPHIPDLKTRLGVDDGGLGLLLLSMAAGAVVALPAAGRLIGRFGNRVVTSTSAAALSIAVVLPVLAPGAASCAIALALLGACNATLDVAMNAQGVMVEDGYERPIMSSFHALFSLGGLAGAGGAATAMAAGMSPLVHLVIVALLSLAAVRVAMGRLLPPAPVRTHVGPIFALPPEGLLGLGLLTFCALLAEGAIGDWSAVYLRDSLGTTPAIAATGFAAFSLAMALGRLVGDRLAQYVGAAQLLRLSGALAAGGLAMSLLMGHPAIALLGFGIVGLGVANLIPILFSAAGRTRGIPPGTALAAVATTGYFGFLAGPPLIGLAAEAAGLPTALAIVCVVCALIAAGAGIVPPPRATLATPQTVASKAITRTQEATHA